MTGPDSNTEARRLIISASAAFAAFGAFWGVWGASIPRVQEQAGVTAGQLGWALLFVGGGALPAMLNSVAEFFEQDVDTRMQAVLALVEPAILILVSIVVSTVLISLYLPIFSLAEKVH